MSWGAAKIILAGEHAVVYGHAAIAGALSLGVRCESAVPGPARVRLAGAGVHADETTLAVCAEAVSAIACEMGAPAEWDVAVHFEVPPGAGLGASAALSVAVARAMAEAQGVAADPASVERWASRADACFHQRASGIDVAIAARGGMGRFRTPSGLQPLALDPLRLVVGVSGSTRPTREMVAEVAALRQREPQRVDEVFATIAEVVAEVEGALERRDRAAIGHALLRNHRALAAIGVSTPRLDHMVSCAMSAGAAGAKLTGGGGGGAVIALAAEDGDERSIVEAWSSMGCVSFVAVVGVPAVGSATR